MSIVCPRCEHENDANARFCVSCGLRIDERPARQDSGTALAPGIAPAPVPSSGSSAAHKLEPAATPTPKPAKRDPLIGREIQGRYQIAAVIGEGGMGKVYRAQQKMGNATRDVAIKVLHPERGRDPQLAARFQRECETVIQLHHPNTVQFFDFGEMKDGTLFIVMEYIHGEPLADVIDRGALTPERAEHLLTQICGSLQEAHDRGIVHRDLKPDNVLLTNVGGTSDFVKVLDFGIAKQQAGAQEEGKSLTQHGVIIGTPPYMSPEQFSSKPLGPQSDVYSLGVMAYEMLTGRLPFDAKTPWEWAAHHMNSEPISLDEHVAGSMIATTRKTAIMRALNKKPEERHDSVTSFLDEFRVDVVRQSGAPMPAPSQAPAPAPGEAESINTTMQVEQAVRRRGLPWWAWAALGVGLLIAGVGVASLAIEKDQPTGAVLKFEPPGADVTSTEARDDTRMVDTPPPVAPRVKTPSKPKTSPRKASSTKKTTPARKTTSPRSTTKPVAETPKKTPPKAPARAAQPAATPTPATTPAPTPTPAKKPAPTPTPTTSERATSPPPTKTPSSGSTPTPAPSGANGEAEISASRAAARRGDMFAAVKHYKRASAALGPTHKSIGRLRRRLGRSGGMGVRTFIRRGECKNAQKLYRELASIGAGGAARRQFDSKNCRQP